ncbi:dopey-1 [Brachionus plicatilis]|uniref:Dopey-1 n=1 Tax=Brachionus plicatilis TaxID=10195 RepID=A0A3M7SF61_BRAPC|nr:dopey-1 [Brachionus plicatilis]
MSLLSPEELTLLHTDNKYKAYVSSIEKCLKNFESSSEWADLISSLGKLKKVIHSSPKYHYIPKRVNVCKRLAQCLHPALPSGVHLKALEVYTCIFQNIGAENLAKDLFLYSSGLFPLLANAALSVKPVLLNLYESYFLPLKKSLRPGLTGLLIAVLPGLEEGSDFYQRTFNLIKNICLAQSDSGASVTNINNYIADDKYFHSCIWSAIISESYIRFAAIQFMLSNYELKKRSGGPVNANDQLYLIGNSIDLMISAICCCLQDANSLVQRSILDLICTCLPMSTKNVTRSDKVQLVTVAIHVVLRRDMTLNRRIYSWLMGNGSSSEESKKNDKKYFEAHSKSILIQSIKTLLNKKEASSILYLLNDEMPVVASQAGTVSHTGQSAQISPGAATTLKLIKIISNLVERQDIGQAIIDDILLDLLFYVYKEYSFLNLNNGPVSSNVQSYLSIKKGTSNFQHVQQQQQQSQNLKDSNELKKAACNFLFHSFQIFFIWDFCASKFEHICKNFTSSNRLESASSHTITSESVHSSTLNPAQLCDLYEFILELLANSDMYNEIQTEHLPVMLKRIIQTITNYCEKMTNQDLSKSFLLCLKILNKIKY